MYPSIRSIVVNTALALALCGSGCGEPSSIDASLVNVYTDVVIARESTLDTVQAQADVRAALARHGYTQERFETALRKAGEDPTTFRALYDSVSARIATKRRSQK
jgi:hypothetical protein